MFLTTVARESRLAALFTKMAKQRSSKMFQYRIKYIFILVFVLTTLLKLAKLQNFSLAPCRQILRVTEEALKVAEIMVWPIPILINMFAALKGSQF